MSHLYYISTCKSHPCVTYICFQTGAKHQRVISLEQRFPCYFRLVVQVTVILLVHGDRHGDGYVTLIVVNENKILVLPIRRLFSKSMTHYMILQGMIGQLNSHKVNHLHNLQTITMGVI